MTRKSSVDGDLGWLILVRAHDHVWRDPVASKVLWELFIKNVGKPAEKPVKFRHME